MPPPCPSHQLGIYVCRRVHPLCNWQEFLLYQRCTPLQFLRVRMWHKRGGPNVDVLH